MFKLIGEFKNHLQTMKHRRYVYSQINRGMHVGSNVMICPGVKFDPPHSFLTSIGDNCILAPDVRFINHDASLYGFGNFARIGKITIRERCFIGAGALLLPGITIGPNSIVGAFSVVTKTVQPDTIVAGNPAGEVRKVSEFVKMNQERFAGNGAPTFKSSEFYPRLDDPRFRKQVLELLEDDIGFTIGGDEDLSFHFNLKRT